MKVSASTSRSANVPCGCTWWHPRREPSSDTASSSIKRKMSCCCDSNCASCGPRKKEQRRNETPHSYPVLACFDQCRSLQWNQIPFELKSSAAPFNGQELLFTFSDSSTANLNAWNDKNESSARSGLTSENYFFCVHDSSAADLLFVNCRAEALC